MPIFEFVLYDLNNWSDEEVKGSVMTRAVVLLFKYILEPELRKKLPDIFSLFKDLEESKTGLQYFESLIRYLLSNTEFELNDLKAMAVKAIDEKKGDLIMSVAERLVQQGIEQGMIQGIDLGRKEGKQEGRQEAMQQGISLVLDIFDKFGQNNKAKIIVSMIKNIYDSDTLNQIEKKLEKTDSVEEFEKIVFKLSK
ncbi:MAG: hypothetical protein CSB21_00745 [Deltaproteobacteria bacterium]|nr:MAG: hypothetical protein CSB21_00745 [Deltaproteobacteria bacterium]